MGEVYYEVHITRALHTARINNVDCVMFIDRNKRDSRFELGKEIEKGVFFFVLSRAWDTVRFLVGTQNFFFVPRS